MKICQPFFSRTRITRAAALALLSIAPMGSALACGSEDYMGSVCVVAFGWCPQNTLPMDGQLLQLREYQALYSLLGTTYGGTAGETFNLPDMRGRVPAGYGAAADLPLLRFGTKDGSAAVALTQANMPAFKGSISGTAQGTVSLPLVNTAVTGQSISGKVTVNALNGDAAPGGGTNIPTGTNNTVGKTGAIPNFYPSGATPVAVPSSHDLAVAGGTVTGQATGPVDIPLAGTVTVAGTAVAVPTIPPRLALNYCIVTRGLYPPRP